MVYKNPRDKSIAESKKTKQDPSVYEKFLEGVFDEKKTHFAVDASKELEDRIINNTGLSQDLDPETGYEAFFTYPEFNKAVCEHMDLLDEKTRKAVTNISEAGQENVLTSLTSKLYDNIVKKANEIDFGDIPNTKGDITKLPNYEKLTETISLLRDILIEFKQDTEPVEILSTALSNIVSRKSMFERAYRYDIELPVLAYNTISLGIIVGTSYLIAACIEFIKSPKDENFAAVLDVLQEKKHKEALIYNSLKKFNKSCASGEFDKGMTYLIEQKAKNLAGTMAVAVTIGTIAGVAIILNIVPILREIIFFVYYSRTRISDFFDVQADLLQMNAYNLEHNENKDPVSRKKIADAQMAVCDRFRSIAKKIAVDCKQAEAKAVRSSSEEKRKLKVDELDSEESISALF